MRDSAPLAVMYNDASVLENFHASEGFKTMIDPNFDIFKVKALRVIYCLYPKAN